MRLRKAQNVLIYTIFHFIGASCVNLGYLCLIFKCVVWQAKQKKEEIEILFHSIEVMFKKKKKSWILFSNCMCRKCNQNMFFIITTEKDWWGFMSKFLTAIKIPEVPPKPRPQTTLWSPPSLFKSANKRT